MHNHSSLQVFSIDRSNFLRPFFMCLVVLFAVFFIPTLAIGLFLPDRVSLFIVGNWKPYLITLIVIGLFFIYRTLKRSFRDIKSNRLHKGREVILTDSSLLITPSLIEELTSLKLQGIKNNRAALKKNSEQYLILDLKDIISWTLVNKLIKTGDPGLHNVSRTHKIRFFDAVGNECEEIIERSPFRSYFNNSDQKFSEAIKDKLGERFFINNTTGRSLF